jgi:hypothetical protein
MKKLLLLAILFVSSNLSSQEIPVDNCLNCHELWEDEDGPAHTFRRDAHFQRNIGCYGCHGGDPTLEDMDEVRKSKGFLGVPDPLEIPQFCANCHSDPTYMRAHNPSLPTDQLDKYRISIHGQRLFEDKDTKVANCVSCHTAHSIANAKLPYASTYAKKLPYTCGSCHADEEYMREYNIPTNQLEEYVNSVHGIALLEHDDLGAPACNDCHSNHGAAPPGVTSLAAVCGVCHAIEAQLYDQSPHEIAFVELDLPMCATCHSNHKIKKPSDSMIGLSEQGVCGDCHSSDDGTSAAVAINQIRSGIGKLLDAADSARYLLANVRQKGMMTSDIEFLMKDVDQAIIQSRISIHAFSADSVLPKVETGIEKADEAQLKAASLIDNYYFRRKGLVISTIIMTFLVVLLYLKIRKIEKR